MWSIGGELMLLDMGQLPEMGDDGGKRHIYVW